MKNITPFSAIGLMAGFLLLVPGTTRAQTASMNFDHGRSAMDIPFEPASNLICLKVSVNGSEPVIFVLDTGAGYNGIDSAFAAKLGLDLSKRKTSARTGASYSELSGLRFGIQGMTAVEQTAKAMPIAQLGAFAGIPIAGILGYDFFKDMVFRVDYSRKNISFFDPKSFSYKGKGQRIPFEITEQKWPLATVRITPEKGSPFEAKMLIDAGAIAPISLNVPGLSETTIPNSVTMGITGPGSGGCFGRLRSVSFGDLVINGPLAAMPAADAGQTSDPIAIAVSQVSAGNIGGELLRRFKVIFDYPGRMMILEPGRDFKKAMEHDMCGVFMVDQLGPVRGFLVIGLTPGSPAEQAGLQPGDLITRLDGKPAGRVTLTRARDLFRRHGKKVSLSITRGQQDLEFTVNLRRMI